jgi:hypothetical protein
VIASNTTTAPAAIPTLAPRLSPALEAPVVPLRLLLSGLVILTVVVWKTEPSIEIVWPGAGCCSHAASKAIASEKNQYQVLRQELLNRLILTIIQEGLVVLILQTSVA